MNTETVNTGKEWKKNFPEYLTKEEAAAYICSTVKKIALFRKMGLLKYSKLGNEFIYKKSWLDEFMETWAGYDMSNPDKIRASIRTRGYRAKHGN